MPDPHLFEDYAALSVSPAAALHFHPAEFVNLSRTCTMCDFRHCGRDGRAPGKNLAALIAL